MLFSLLSSGDLRITLISLILSLPVILFALCIHETAHGFVAWKCGDPTAHDLGRLTLNPAKHLDPIGFLCMLIFGFGWAKPVPINTRYFKNPKRGMAITAAAGPIANLLVGLISTILAALFEVWLIVSSYHAGFNGLSFIGVSTAPIQLYILFALYLLFQVSAMMNFTLMIFNLIPIPPFDGSRIITVFLPTNLYFRIMRYEQQIMIGLLVGLFLLSHVFDISLTGWLSNLLYGALFKPFENLFLNLFESLHLV